MAAPLLGTVPRWGRVLGLTSALAILVALPWPTTSSADELSAIVDAPDDDVTSPQSVQAPVLVAPLGGGYDLSSLAAAAVADLGSTSQGSKAVLVVDLQTGWSASFTSAVSEALVSGGIVDEVVPWSTPSAPTPLDMRGLGAQLLVTASATLEGPLLTISIHVQKSSASLWTRLVAPASVAPLTAVARGSLSAAGYKQLGVAPPSLGSPFGSTVEEISLWSPSEGTATPWPLDGPVVAMEIVPLTSGKPLVVVLTTETLSAARLDMATGHLAIIWTLPSSAIPPLPPSSRSPTGQLAMVPQGLLVSLSGRQTVVVHPLEGTVLQTAMGGELVGPSLAPLAVVGKRRVYGELVPGTNLYTPVLTFFDPMTDQSHGAELPWSIMDAVSVPSCAPGAAIDALALLTSKGQLVLVPGGELASLEATAPLVLAGEPAASSESPPVSTFGSALAGSDVDRDGMPELWTTGTGLPEASEDMVSLLVPTSCAEAGVHASWTVPPVTTIGVGDVDGDGYDEALVASAPWGGLPTLRLVDGLVQGDDEEGIQ